MVEIVTSLYKYVPQVEYLEEYHMPETDETISLVVLKRSRYHWVGTSSLKQEQASIKIKATSESPSTRLEGFLPTVENWHTKLTLFEVSLRYIPILLYYSFYSIFCR